MKTIGSCFSGIGGIELGFERTGLYKTAWQIEIDPYCRKVLEKNFPHAKRHNDIRECGSHNLERVDVIVGGFPCQDISNAGKRAGIGGDRSGLWAEQFRIISELRPSFALVENVRALLGRGIETVLGDLSEIGYDAEWQVISAADMGAPHLRERVWIVAYPNRRRPEGQGKTNGFDRQRVSERKVPGCYGQGRALADTDSQGPAYDCQGDQRIEGDAGRNAAGASRDAVADAGCPRLSEPEQTPVFGARWREQGGAIAERGWWAVEPELGRVADGIPRRVDRLKGLGNAVVPQIPELIARLLS